MTPDGARQEWRRLHSLIRDFVVWGKVVRRTREGLLAWNKLQPRRSRPMDEDFIEVEDPLRPLVLYAYNSKEKPIILFEPDSVATTRVEWKECWPLWEYVRDSMLPRVRHAITTDMRARHAAHKQELEVIANLVKDWRTKDYIQVGENNDT